MQLIRRMVIFRVGVQLLLLHFYSSLSASEEKLGPRYGLMIISFAQAEDQIKPNLSWIKIIKMDQIILDQDSFLRFPQPTLLSNTNCTIF